MGKKLILILTIILVFLNTISAAHYITGYVENAKDGENANSHIVKLWNPANGQADYLTDEIGVNGNAKFASVFMIDCELLQTPCSQGNKLSVQIQNSGDDYISKIYNITVSTAGYDFFTENITLNSKPTSQITQPQSFYVKENFQINCSYQDLDQDIGKITLYTNITGTLETTQTKIPQNNYAIFTINPQEGSYEFLCQAQDTLNIKTNSSKKTFYLDKTNPTISSLNSNESFLCKDKTTYKIQCQTQDDKGISEVLLNIKTNSNDQNITLQEESQNTFVTSLTTSEIDPHILTCISKDLAGNQEYSQPLTLNSYDNSPELKFFKETIQFQKNSPKENTQNQIQFKITNNGCQDSTSFSIGLYKNQINPENLINEKTISFLNSFQNLTEELNFTTIIGKNNYFIFIDKNNQITEQNKTNNKENKTLNVRMWQEVYGNISSIKELGIKSLNFTSWKNYTIKNANIFIADSESTIEWSNLLAIGTDKQNQNAPNDLNELDEIFQTTDYIDSIQKTFQTNTKTTFKIENTDITNVPTINTTQNFKTGILWDSSDSTDNEFDKTEKEDIVFVTQVNKNSQGMHGTYDYEIKIPVKLREYHTQDTKDVYLYYEIE